MEIRSSTHRHFHYHGERVLMLGRNGGAGGSGISDREGLTPPKPRTQGAGSCAFQHAPKHTGYARPAGRKPVPGKYHSRCLRFTHQKLSDAKIPVGSRLVMPSMPFSTRIRYRPDPATATAGDGDHAR